MDSACSRHMMGDRTKFTQLKMQKRGIVSFVNENKAKIAELGTISTNPLFEEVFSVSSLN